MKQFAARSSMCVQLLHNPVKGYGPTRRMGLDQVVMSYAQRYPKADKSHFIIILDADAELVPEWGVHHNQLITQEALGAVGVTYRFPLHTDLQIQQVSGLPQFLFSIASAANKLTAMSIAKSQTGTKGGVVEVGAYAAIDGAPLVAADKSGVSAEDRVMGDRVREVGLRVAFNPAMNMHNPRRVLFEIANKIGALQTYDVAPEQMRTMQMAMKPEQILEAMMKMERKDWLTYHRARLRSFVQRNIIDPISNGEICPNALCEWVESHDLGPDSLSGDIDILTDAIIRIDDSLAAIYNPPRYMM